MRQRLSSAAVLAIAVVAVRCGPAPVEELSETPIITTQDTLEPVAEPPTGPAAVDAARLFAADGEPDQWMSHARTYGEQRFSPLDQITRETVANLGLAWYADLDTHRGQESTPLMIDGVLYLSTAWSKVMAYDARSGEMLWTYDPETPGQWAVHACCDVVNRGVAAWEGKIFVGALDGRLVALDAETGREVWTVDTVDRDLPYTITGAPRVVKGMVIIGNRGEEFGVRGYVSAYDADTGELQWRFHTVPGNPANGFETSNMAHAAETWAGAWWAAGGGGAVSDAIAYDPELDLLYVGVGAGSPWNHTLRSAGEGDNLFLSSIVALDPDDGSYAWHYQTTPADSWGHAATQQITVADLTIDGEERRVVMQAPTNGFFYVLDAANGAFISAAPAAEVSWADAIDPATGRPTEAAAARYDVTTLPFASGRPPGGGSRTGPTMSFSPLTGLAYIPVRAGNFVFAPSAGAEARPLIPHLGIAPASADTPATAAGRLVAWDPIAQREVWRVERDGPMNGGVLATAGGLVFQGAGGGVITALDAETGEELWWSATRSGVIAPPITYAIDGTQYVAIVVGTGGELGVRGDAAGMTGADRTNRSRLLVYTLGGEAEAPFEDEPLALSPGSPPPPVTASTETITIGAALYAQACARCHGAGADNHGILPDLRHSASLRTADAWAAIVSDGVQEATGMAGFADALNDEEVEAVRAYVISQANAAHEAEPPVSQ